MTVPASSPRGTLLPSREAGWVTACIIQLGGHLLACE
jgi:hypothetical protein